MKPQVYFGIALRIIILGAVGMLWTFVGPELRDFLGDHPGVDDHAFFGMDKGWIWGARHFWYWWMMFLLFLLSLLNCIVGGVNIINKHYPNL